MLPDVNRDDNSIEGSCGSIVERAFDEKLTGQAFLLTETNALEAPGQCLSVPQELLEVWTPAQLSAEFGRQCLSILSRYVREQDRKKFVNWELIKRLDRMTILETLRSNNLPRPGNWQGMCQLWSYVSDEIATPWSLYRNMRIVPVRGEQLLYSADKVVRLGERRNFSDTDSEFLAPYILVLDQDWVHFLAAQRRALEIGKYDDLWQQINEIDGVLRSLGLSEASDAGRVLRHVSDSFFSRRTTKNLEDYVRLAHIAAKLGATIPDNFQYVSQNSNIRQAKKRLSSPMWTATSTGLSKMTGTLEMSSTRLTLGHQSPAPPQNGGSGCNCLQAASTPSYRSPASDLTLQAGDICGMHCGIEESKKSLISTINEIIFALRIGISPEPIGLTGIHWRTQMNCFGVIC